MRSTTIFFIIGLYLGKYYPEYIPLPKLSKENTEKSLKYLKELEEKMQK